MDVAKFKMDVDFVCSGLEFAFPAEASTIESINLFIDKYADFIAPAIPDGLSLTKFVQAVFDGLNSHLASHPIMLGIAKAFEAWVLAQLPAAAPILMAKKGFIGP